MTKGHKEMLEEICLFISLGPFVILILAFVFFFPPLPQLCFLSLLTSLHFLEFHISGIIQYAVTFYLVLSLILIMAKSLMGTPAHFLNWVVSFLIVGF